MSTAAEPLAFGPRLRQFRIAAGLTQEMLAERTGLGVRSIQHLEGGAHLPQRDTVGRLVRALELSGEDRSQFERAAQPPPRRREAVSHPPGEAPDDRLDQRPPRHNLPAQLTSFVGRERELAEVRQLLGEAPSGPRLVTVTGVGGTGKTRLALQVATDLVGVHPDGVWFVDLAPLTDPSLVAQTVASPLGIVEQAGQPLLATLQLALREQRLLFVLDNCEHLVDAVAVLAESVLKSCPKVQILATSREALGIGGEVTWPLPSLPVPAADWRAASDLDVSEFAAIRLFVERAHSAEASFKVTNQNEAAVVEICRRLDGIPLAIELAAARVKVLSVEQIVTRLNDRFQLLTGGKRTALPRQQTLRATLDWSHNVLSEPERAAFRRLSVFAGGFNLDAAEAVCSGEILDLLSQLVEKSLLLVDKRSGETRYRFLETARQYGGERLDEAGETTTTTDRLAEWCLGLAEQAEPELLGPRQDDWLERLELEHDNLRAALTWSRSRPSNVEIRLAGSLRRFWRMRSSFSEGRAWLDGALSRNVEGSAARAKALLGDGVLTYEQGDYQTALSLLEESAAWCRQVGAKEPLVDALNDIGLCLWMVGEDVDRVRAVWDEGLALEQDLGNEHGTAWLLCLLGGLSAYTHELGRARDFSDRAVELFRRAGDSWGLSQALGSLGGVLLMQRDIQRARQAVEEQLAIARRLGSRYGMGTALYGLARVAQSDDDPDHVRRLLAESLRLLHQIGSRGIFDVLRGLGALAVRRGDPARGVRLLAAGPAGRIPIPGLWLWLRDRETLQAEWETSLEMARSVLGEDSFARAWAEGQEMTLEQTIAYALEADET